MNKLAIIGYSYYLPNANNDEDFWALLCGNKSTFSEIPPSRWDIDGFYSPNRMGKNVSSCKWMSSIDLEKIDSDYRALFNMPEPASNNPQQKMLLLSTSQALMSSDISQEELDSKKISVVVGTMANDNLINLSENGADVNINSTLGNLDSQLSNRISQHFGFSGESKTINTACSSSLVAISDAYKLLVNRDCDICVVSAVNLSLNKNKYISFSKAGVLSENGYCLPFDISADGYIPSDAVVTLIISTLDSAIYSKYNIHAVIDSVSINHNANRSISPTAPNVESQIDLLNQSLRAAAISESEVSYIEAHGTGTLLGDPIEIEAIRTVFYTGKYNIGSLKGIIGHAEAAAGMASLIKIILMLKNRVIPGNSWIKKINPLISERVNNSKFNVTSLPWLKSKKKVYSSISSFGIGGTNANMILSNFVNSNSNQYEEGYYLFNNEHPSSSSSMLDYKAISEMDVITLCNQENLAVYYCDKLNFQLFTVNNSFVNYDFYIKNVLSVYQDSISKILVSSNKILKLDILNKFDILTVFSFILSDTSLYICFPMYNANIKNALDNIENAFTETASLLAVNQQTYKIFLSKWEKLLLPDIYGHEIVKSIFAYIDLCIKWGLEIKNIDPVWCISKVFIENNVCDQHVLFTEENIAFESINKELSIDMVIKLFKSFSKYKLPHVAVKKVLQFELIKDSKIDDFFSEDYISNLSAIFKDGNHISLRCVDNSSLPYNVYIESYYND